MPYQPIENYGVVGDLHTVALIGSNGSIDWMCYPDFDSPSIFAALLDADTGGSFYIGPADEEEVNIKQFYWPQTNVLVTRFLTSHGVGEIRDFMPIPSDHDSYKERHVIRRVSVARGRMTFRMVCRPRFDYAREVPNVELCDNGAVFSGNALRLGLSSTEPLEKANGSARCSFLLEEGTSVAFILHELRDEESCQGALSDADSHAVFEDTVKYWRNWLAQSTYKGRWRAMVERSALVLKLLTYKPTGAIVAAPTCSLPESIGGSRNWDYRYTWIRDAAFTLYALLRIGFTEEAAEFMDYIQARAHELNEDGSLQIMYGIKGDHEIEESELEHLEGYRGSGPVRIGNRAYNQLQLDIYGELMDSVYLYNKYGSPISYDFWVELRRLLNWLADNWRREDEGIWEVRGGARHFTYSKLMAWVAFDRGLRLADKRSFPAPRERWMQERDTIYEEIMEKSWNSDLKAFVQSYDSTALDASNLIMPLVFFLSPTDTRMLQTLDATMKPPDEGGLTSDSLVYRYNMNHAPDGLPGEEGTFNICTFWMVEALTRAGHDDPEHLERSRLMFEQMMGYANHLGLFGEETGPRGEALGNFPQAFTHLALISAAFNLDRTLG